MAVFALLVSDVELMEKFEVNYRQQIEIRKKCICNQTGKNNMSSPRVEIH